MEGGGEIIVVDLVKKCKLELEKQIFLKFVMLFTEIISLLIGLHKQYT